MLRPAAIATALAALSLAACDGGRPSSPGGGGRGVPPNNQTRTDGSTSSGDARTEGTFDAGFVRDDSGRLVPVDVGVLDFGFVEEPDAGSEEPRDSGVIRPNPDATTNPTDTGIPLMCGDNPFGCSPHELLNPSDCSCLGVCEPGWRYESSFGGQCIPEGDGGTTIRDSGVRDSGTTTRPDAGPSDPFNLASSVSSFSSALCAYRTRCEPALYPYERKTETNCRSEQNIRWTSIWGAFAQAAQNGTMSFHQASLSACISGLGSADCVLGMPAACDSIFTGNLGLGAPCSLFEECGNGTFCDVNNGLACGTCRAGAADGQSCDTLPCSGPGSLCWILGGTQTICIRSTNGVGDPCGDASAGMCTGRLQCVGDQCVRPALNGSTCDELQSTGPDCDIYMSSVCVNGTCQRVTWVGPNAACSGASLCDNRGACNTTSQTCTQRPGAGSVCLGTNELCAPDTFCSNGTCTADGTSGSSCVDFGDCANGLFCQASGTCNPLTWSSCP